MLILPPPTPEARIHRTRLEYTSTTHIYRHSKLGLSLARTWNHVKTFQIRFGSLCTTQPTPSNNVSQLRNGDRLSKCSVGLSFDPVPKRNIVLCLYFPTVTITSSNPIHFDSQSTAEASAIAVTIAAPDVVTPKAQYGRREHRRGARAQAVAQTTKQAAQRQAVDPKEELRVCSSRDLCSSGAPPGLHQAKP